MRLDLEADVCKQNEVYTWLLTRLGELSGRVNIVTDIVEEWETETGPIELRYKLYGDERHSQPQYLDDWVDQVFIDTTLEEISKIVNQPSISALDLKKNGLACNASRPFAGLFACRGSVAAAVDCVATASSLRRAAAT